MDALADFVMENSLEVLGVGETWLLNSDSSSFVDISGFSFIRADVKGFIRKHVVGVYVANTLKFEDIVVDVPNCIIIKLIDFELVLIVVYRPPSYTESENNRLCDLLIKQCVGSEVLILGDFNLPSLKWDSDLPTVYVPPLDRKFLDIFISLGLTQWICCPTYILSDNILDLILSSEGDRVGEVAVCPPLPGCLHSPIVCDYVFQFQLDVEDDQCRFGYAWHKGNYEAISENIFERDWNFEFAYRTAGDCFAILRCFLLHLVERYVPTRKLKPSVPWRVHPPRSMKRVQKNAWAAYRGVRNRLGRQHPLSQVALEEFNRANAALRSFSFASRCSYEEDLIARVGEAPKLIHSYVRWKKGRPTIGPLKLGSGEIVRDNGEMSNVFVDAFAAVFVVDIPDQPVIVQPVGHVIGAFHFSVRVVRWALMALDTQTSMGPDDLHPILLKSCASALAEP